MKTCSMCGHSKHLSEFHHSKTGRDGTYAYCRTCGTEQSKRWRHANPEKSRSIDAIYNAKRGAARQNARQKRDALEATGFRTCRGCQQVLPLANFTRHPLGRNGLQPRCKTCRSLEKADWCARRPDLRRNQKHRRRARLHNVSGSPYTTTAKIKARIDYYANKCVYCGAKANTIDHRIPIARGGPHLPANLIPACQTCNSRKNTKTEREYLATLSTSNEP